MWEEKKIRYHVFCPIVVRTLYEFAKANLFRSFDSYHGYGGK